MVGLIGRFLFSVSLVLALTGALTAQVESARIIGAVTDQTGAIVPGSRITIVNVNTNIGYETTSGEDGRYESIPLRIGSYRVTAELAGFKLAVRDGIVLQIQETAVIDIAMEVGVVSESVAVTADAPLLVTTESTQGQVIDNQKIVDLPLNGRDYIQLALLSAGAIQPHPGARFGGFSGSGVRPSENNYILDGIDNNAMQNAAQGRPAETVKPSVDAVQEFKVLTNNFSAEYGRAAGAVVNVSIKSGSNEFHGTVFEFLRNEALDAKNFFDLPQDPKPPFKRNQYGFSFGGPVIRNRTFFFGDYEGTRIRESRTVNNTIPTSQMRSGNFSELLPGTRIYDPATYNPTTRLRTQFPDNVIPRVRFDSVGERLINLYPAPNKAGLTQNFLFNPADAQDQDRGDVRIDHMFSSKSNLFTRYSVQDRFEPAAPSLPAPAFGGGDQASNFTHTGSNAMIGYNHVFTPTLILSAKIGWNKIFTRREAPVETNLNRELGIKGVDQDIAGMAQINSSGYTSLGIGGTTPNHIGSRTWQYIADVSWIRNKHSLKFGTNVSYISRFLFNPRESVGIFTLDAGYTRHPVTVREGNSIADLLLGTPSAGQVSNTVLLDERAPYYDAYVHDEWRVTNKLTLNLGVRYEFHLPWVDINDHKTNPDLSDFANPILIQARSGGSRFDRALVNTDKNNFGPRFGLAYQLSNKTVLRGGYGVYYGNVVFQGALAFNPPFHYSVNLSTDRINPTIKLQEGLPLGLANPTNASNIVLSGQEMSGHFPYSQQWNISIQNQLPGDMLWEVGYYANTLHKEARQQELNWAPPGAGNINNRRIYKSILVPGDNVVIGPLAAWTNIERSANANFHSFQTKIEKRYSSGLSFLASYIFAKTINDARGAADSGGNGSLLPQNPLNLRAERGIADEHIAHRFVSSYVYELPIGRGRGALGNAHPIVNGILGNWSVAGINTLSSGRYVNLTVQGNPSNSGGPDRPNVLHDWRLSDSQRTLEQWFDTTAFARNDPFTFGNAARNLVEGPGFVNFDFSVYKTFPIKELMSVQFRFEAFNLFNSPAFEPPNIAVGNLNFGQIASADRPRNLQFGLKLIF